MPRQAGSRAAILVILAGALAASPGPAVATGAGFEAPSARRGEEIYTQGTSPAGGGVVALMGEAGIEVPAAALPCASCHGHDGRGRPEGGVSPSDVTWRALTRNLAGSRPGERRRPAYDERGLKRAIAMGVDAGGNRLDPVMPRYRLTLGDMADLVAYLETLGERLDPGLTDEALRLATLLPPDPTLARAVEGLLRAYLEDLNRGGGLYGRRLELVAEISAGNGETRRAAAARFLEEAEPFALVAPYLAGAEEPLAGLLGERRVPAVGPMALDPPLGFPLNRHLFYLYAGLGDQARALARWNDQGGGGGGPLMVVYPGAEPGPSLAAAVAEARPASEPVLLRPASPGLPEAGELAREGREGEIGRVLFLGGGRELSVLLAAAGSAGWRPTVQALGPLVGTGSDLPAGFAGRLALSLPTLPVDLAPAAVAEAHRLAAAAGLPRGDHPAQLAALAAARLLVEGLRRAGRDLSRERLIEVLEETYRYDTGLTRALTFTANRRVGTDGTYVLELDPTAERPVQGARWVPLAAR